MNLKPDLQELAINTIRFLSADGVQQANSGHPGLPMGTAAIAYTLWTRHIKMNPSNPDWVDRDRFILSGGHGSMLLYSLLHLSGFSLPLDELKKFRQWGSNTPGHPEYGLTPGIETTTGPLGQGFANGVGMAIAEAHLAAEFNQIDFDIVNHFTYAIVTDGDLMEGITSEAASLAGHLKLGKMIYFYDDNHITIDGSTDLAFTEDRGERFLSYGWQVLYVKDGNDVEEIDRAILIAKSDSRPSLVICRTHIGYGLPTKQDTEKAHGEPPGVEELMAAKQKIGWPLEPAFFIPKEVQTYFEEIKKNGVLAEEEWKKKFLSYQQAYPELAAEFTRRTKGNLPQGWENDLPVFTADPKGMATRQSSHKVINALARVIPEFIGGSADLTPSNKTWIEDSLSFQKDSLGGRNLHFGIRENAMGAIVNGISYHKGLRPFGATFLVFSDYMRPTIRISALSKLPSIWVFTHDSIGLGEDGPTHQPVEHLLSLRSIPDLVVIRPSDANETREAWKVALERNNGPTALIFSRQNLPTIDRSIYSPAEGLKKGAYTLADLGGAQPDIILMASGSEVQLIIDAGKRLVDEGKKVRIVSFPSWELFINQPSEYQESILSPDIKIRIAVEAGVSLGWQQWVGNQGKIIGLDHFGASAPAEILFEEFGFTVENIVKTAMELVK